MSIGVHFNYEIIREREKKRERSSTSFCMSIGVHFNYEIIREREKERERDSTSFCMSIGVHFNYEIIREREIPPPFVCLLVYISIMKL